MSRVSFVLIPAAASAWVTFTASTARAQLDAGFAPDTGELSRDAEAPDMGGWDAGSPGGYEGCSTATDLGDLSLGTLTLPYLLSGRLDSTPETPDIDFYRINGATPGLALSLSVNGTPTSTDSLTLIGVFDTSCALLQRGTAPSLAVTVPPDGVVIIAVTQIPDYEFRGGGVGAYEIGIRALESIGSITGQVIDAETGAPIDYYQWPTVELAQCLDAECASASPVASTSADWWSGFFILTTSWWGQPLEPGDYRVVVSAHGYQPQMISFRIAAGQHLDLGVFALVAEPRVGSISGGFVDRDTGEPLQALVYLNQCFSEDCSLRNNVSSGWTDSSGRFTFTHHWNGQPLVVGTYQVEFTDAWWPARHLPYASDPFSVGRDEHLELGNLAVAPVPTIGSIRGRVSDLVTRAGLSGASEPYAFVYVQICGPVGCSFGQATPDAAGNFRIDRDNDGQALFLGEAYVYASARQYLPAQLRLTDLVEREDRNLGDVALQSHPIRFSNVQPCANVPSSGGRCRFSVTLTNGQAGALSATVWTEIDAWGIGSFVGASSFTLGKQSVGFGPGTRGAQKTLSFDLDVPAVVSDYATFCATAWAGQGTTNPFLDTIGSSYLFCVIKDPSTPRYRMVTEREGREMIKKPLSMLDPRPASQHMQRRSGRRPARAR